MPRTLLYLLLFSFPLATGAPQDASSVAAPRRPPLTSLTDSEAAATPAPAPRPAASTLADRRTRAPMVPIARARSQRPRSLARRPGRDLLLDLVFVLVLLCVLSLSLLAPASAFVALRMVTQPSDSTGGVPFPVQPAVEAVQASGLRDTSVQNSTVVTASLFESPDPFRVLVGDLTAPFEDGLAVFANLTIREVGDNYRLLFEVEGLAVRAVVSQPLNITRGPPAQLVVSNQPGLADGGRPFRAQPAVQLQDAGGNVVETENSTAVTVSLVLDNATSPTAELWSSLDFTTTMVAGTATWTDLAIDLAGLGYVLRFNASIDPSDVPLSGPSIDSEVFSVGVGPTARLVVLTEPDGARGGHAFTSQPVIELQDAGGNRNVEDSHSTVTVYILHNTADPDVAGPAFGRGRDAVLSPEYLYWRYNESEITASPTNGNVYVNVSADPNANLSVPLFNGDYVQIGDGDDAFPPSPTRGAQIRRLRPADELRFRLELPWEGPTGTDLPLTKVELGFVRPVLAGVARFENLTLDRIGRNYSLVFVSSLRPHPEGFLLGRGRRGFGRVGYGYGYGLELPFLSTSALDDAFVQAVIEGRRDDRVDPAVAPNISVVSQAFDVTLGDPARLRVDVPAAGAWAGGQPFRQQPVVSLVDWGGNVVSTNNEDSIQVELLVDPTNSSIPALFGNTSIRMERGRVEFVDLGLLRRGTGFQLRFFANVTGFGFVEGFQTLDVLPSAEWQVMNYDSQPGDWFGFSVDVDGDLAVVGSPHDRVPVHEVQVVRTDADATEFLPEIQSVTTAADLQYEVQRIAVSVRANETLRGTFFLQWELERTRNIPVDAYEDYIKVVIEQDLRAAQIGEVVVTRDRATAWNAGPADRATEEDSDGSGSVDRRAWQVTFLHRVGPVPLLDLFLGTSLAALPEADANVTRLFAATVIGGTFTLSLGNLTTPAIDADVQPRVLKFLLEDHLDCGTVTVQRNIAPAGSPMRAFNWVITFTPRAFGYDVPDLVPDGSGLTGLGARVFVHTVQQGQGPITGSFSLYFRGEGPSPPIPHDATVAQFRAALEALPTVDLLDVSRSGPTAANGYSWTVTFLLTRNRTDEGFVLDQGDLHHQDLPPIESPRLGVGFVPYSWLEVDFGPAPHNMLAGTGARVSTVYIHGDPKGAPWDPSVAGRRGTNAGSVYVFRREFESWVPDTFQDAPVGLEPNGTTFRLRGSDTDEEDLFGWSVSLHNSRLAVGAPGAGFRGALEQQRLTCEADAGSFQLSWRGRTTASLSFDATLTDLKNALEALPNLHTVRVQSDPDGTPPLAGPLGPVCSTAVAGGQRTLITFVWPQDGNVEPLEIVAQSLTWGGASNATLAVEDDVVRGTRVSSGDNASDQAVGAVYVFEEAPVGSGAWTQVQILHADDATRSLADMFGHAVALHGSTLAVGAPEDSTEALRSGAVYLFRRRVVGGVVEWSQYQRLTGRTSQSVAGAGFRFGHAVALFEDTLVVASPGKHAGDGEVLVFKRRPLLSASFLIDQVLLPLPYLVAGFAYDPLRPAPRPVRAANAPYECGTSVAVEGDVLAIGCPGGDAPFTIAAMEATSVSPATRTLRSRTGLVLVHDRRHDHELFGFEPRQTLVPSAAVEDDRVGTSVGVSGNVVVAGATRGFTGVGKPREEVQVVATTADAGATIGNYFTLQWRRDKVPATRGPDALSGGRRQDPLWIWRARETRRLAKDITARALREALEEDLGVGRVNVTRFGPNQEGGYRWFITFREASDRVESFDLPLLEPVDTTLSGAGARVTVARLSTASPATRGASFVFTRASAARPNGGGYGARWTEQGVLTPYAPQRTDLFGRALAVSGNTAIVGATNRDRADSGVNGGAALLFDLAILNLRIDLGDEALEAAADPSSGGDGPDGLAFRLDEGARQYYDGEDVIAFGYQTFLPRLTSSEAPEERRVRFAAAEDDGHVDLAVRHCDPECRVPVGEPLAESGSLEPEQPFLLHAVSGDDWGYYARVDDASLVPAGVHGPWAQHVARAPAHGPPSCRPADEGTTHCEFLSLPGLVGRKSGFDAAARSDFAPFHSVPFTLAADPSQPTSNVSIPITLTDDTIVEVPDETFHVRLSLPGFEPAFGGDLWKTVTVLDDGDGSVGSRGYVQRLFSAEEPPLGAAFGAAVDMAGSVAVVGAPRTDLITAVNDDGSANTTLRQAGRAFVFARHAGLWTLDGELAPSVDYAGARFGSGVAVAPNGAALAVTSTGGGGGDGPRAIGIHFFHRPTNASEFAWVSFLQPNLTTQGAGAGSNLDRVAVHHEFGTPRSVAMTQDSNGGYVAAVGCRGLELVFIFRDPSGNGSWAQTAVLYSSAYRPIRWLEITYLLREAFGASVSFSDSTLVVGAPTGNYGAFADPTSYAEVLAMDEFTSYRGTGRVYAFQLVENRTQAEYTGTGDGTWTALLGWPAGDAAVAASQRPPVFNDTGGALPDGSAGLPGLWVEHAFVNPSDGRPADRFGEAVDLDGAQLIVGAWGNPAQTEATWDFETGDLRGWVATGPAFASQPTFGDNTAARPVYSNTFGPLPPQNARHRGRYWVGTYEKRPGDPANPTQEPASMPGTVQGDAPQGTLTSDPFLIAGSAISFLVGGGCDERTVFVELLVDGEPTFRATGACSEEMTRVHWRVGAHRGRAGQIRVADLSSGQWGHINVDDFRFDWDMARYENTPHAGAAYVFRRKAPLGATNPDEKCPRDPATNLGEGSTVLTCAWEEQGKLEASDLRRDVHFAFDVAVDDSTGVAVVAAVHHSTVHPDWYHPGSLAGVRLGTSGKQEGSFRADGGINSGLTYADVNVWGTEGGGDPDVVLTGPRPRVVSPFLEQNVGSSRGDHANTGEGDWDSSGLTGLLGGSGPHSTSGRRFDTRGSGSGRRMGAGFDTGNPTDSIPLARTPQVGGDIRAPLVEPVARNGETLGLGLGRDAPEGILYVFRREPEKRGGRGRLASPPRWTQRSQTAQLAMPWVGPGSFLGSSIALDGFTLLAGAPGDAQLGRDVGSVVALDTEPQRLGFEFRDYTRPKTEHVKFDFEHQDSTFASLGLQIKSYSVSEGFHLKRVILPVIRYGRANEGELRSTLHVHYSTRDVTAFGVSRETAEACWDLPRALRNRAGCGDYVQTAGVLTFAPGRSRQDIVVYIMDDECFEPETELFHVQLALPGGAALRGHGFSVTVRIDDDDAVHGRDTCRDPWASIQED